MGRKAEITRYDNPTVGSGSIVNQLKFVYNDFGQLVTEYQEHGGAVNTGTSLKVQYAYADGSSNTIRPTKMTYPDGRELNYDYGSAGSAGDALSRVASLIDDDGSTHLVDYSYLGRNTFVKTDYPEPDLRYDLAMGAGDDPYDGFDRFGRVVDSRWYDYGSSADVDRILYGYDRAGNRTYREQTCDTNSYHDEVYAHDGINRLTDFDRGTINGNKDAISTLKFAQQWNLDPTGNWSAFKEDDDGDSSWDIEQARTSNEVNEITNITETSGPAWVTPAYNRAGNMTTIPKPADPTASFAATYDAWNRLVKLEEGEDTVAEYGHDGAKRRVVKKTYDSGELDETRHFYYTDPQKWQVIEERLESSGVISANPDRQFVWGLRYIDDFLLRDRDTDSNGSLDERLYALQDANWNVTALADTSGDVQERYAYSAYGMPSVLTAAFGARAASNYGAEVLYAGYRYDGRTDLYHVRHRAYRPALGGWAQRDPLGASSEIHLYEYGRGRTTILTDSAGLKAKHRCGTGVPGIPLDLLFFEPYKPTRRLGAWMQVEVDATDLCVSRKHGKLKIDLTFRWVQYAKGLHRNPRYLAMVDGQQIAISEGNDTGQLTPVDPPEQWPWPGIGQIEVKQWYAWTGSYTKQLEICPFDATHSVIPGGKKPYLEIRVSADYSRNHPQRLDMVETAEVKWDYSCPFHCGVIARYCRPFRCSVTETSYKSVGVQPFRPKPDTE